MTSIEIIDGFGRVYDISVLLQDLKRVAQELGENMTDAEIQEILDEVCDTSPETRAPNHDSRASLPLSTIHRRMALVCLNLTVLHCLFCISHMIDIGCSYFHYIISAV